MTPIVFFPPLHLYCSLSSLSRITVFPESHSLVGSARPRMSLIFLTALSPIFICAVFCQRPGSSWVVSWCGGGGARCAEVALSKRTGSPATVTFLLPEKHPGPPWDKELDRLGLEHDFTGCQVISRKIPGLNCPSFFYGTGGRLSLSLAAKRAPRLVCEVPFLWWGRGDISGQSQVLIGI